MKQNKSYYIIYEKSFQEFQKHLENDENERIIFSAKYGMGKQLFSNNSLVKKIRKILLISIRYSGYSL
jgi:hypothetical protein